jgi:4'-phosphopantetheinyl transferase
MAGRIAAGAVGVWFSTTPQDEAALLDAVRLLSDEERQRADRFVRLDDRVDFIWSHAVLRRALASVGGRPAELWQFATGLHGKPHVVDEQQTDVPLEFNLTHTRGSCACAVGHGLKGSGSISSEFPRAAPRSTSPGDSSTRPKPTCSPRCPWPKPSATFSKCGR